MAAYARLGSVRDQSCTGGMTSILVELKIPKTADFDPCLDVHLLFCFLLTVPELQINRMELSCSIGVALPSFRYTWESNGHNDCAAFLRHGFQFTAFDLYW